MPGDPGDPSGSVSRREFLVASGVAGAAVLAGCTERRDAGEDGGNGDELSGEVVVTGSSTVFPVSDAMAERFMAEHPDVNVTVDATGTGGGFENHFCTGDSDVNGASRPIEDGEVERCLDNGVGPVEFRVAGDALTVAVNNDADWVNCVTLDELSRIWREDGAGTWSDVRDDWPGEELELFGPASTSGTYDWFDEHVVGPDHDHTAEHEPTEEDNLIVQGIRDSRYAMGYFGYAYYSENSEAVKPVEIRRSKGEDCTPPSLENARDGSYPLARPLFIYAAESAIQRDPVYEFLRFYLRRAATDLVGDIGYVPVSQQVRDENLDRLDGVRG